MRGAAEKKQERPIPLPVYTLAQITDKYKRGEWFKKKQ